MGELAEEGRKERFVILQRSRREHYDLVLSQGEETLGETFLYFIRAAFLGFDCRSFY